MDNKKAMKNLLIISAAGLGIWGAFTVVNQTVNDYSQSFKLSIRNMKFKGFPKDVFGNWVYTRYNVQVEFEIINLSSSALTLKDLMLQIQYEGSDKLFYGFAYSEKPISLNIKPKAGNIFFVGLQVSIPDLLNSTFIKVFTRAINFNITADFNAFGVNSHVNSIQKLEAPKEFATLLAILFARLGIKGLGYAASRLRTLKGGQEYSIYIKDLNKPDKVTLLDKNADTENVVNQIIRASKECAYQTQRLAQVLYEKDLRKYAFKIYKFIYNHIQYRLDEEGEEQLREPCHLWRNRRRGGDCDCMALFVSTLLRANNIKHFFRVVKMGGGKAYQHIYVVVPTGKYIWHDPQTYVVIDPVMEYFNGKDPYGVSSVFDFPVI